MDKNNQLFTLKHVLSSILMLAMLVWLTVCLPFVNESQQAAKAQTEQSDEAGQNNDGNPLSNTNEEKSESGTSLLSEYLHDISVVEHHFVTLTSFFKGHPSDLYLAYHPDLIIPPPEA